MPTKPVNAEALLLVTTNVPSTRAALEENSRFQSTPMSCPLTLALAVRARVTAWLAHGACACWQDEVLKAHATFERQLENANKAASNDTKQVQPGAALA